MVEARNALEIDDDVTLWAPGDRTGLPLLVLLHGYGGDENRMFGLFSQLPDGIAIAAVAAPLRPTPPQPGRAWYPVDSLDAPHEESVTVATRALLSWLDGAADGASKIALLGFSQGGAVSVQAMRLDPERIDTAVVLSGYVSSGETANDPSLRQSRPKVFWGRGPVDDALPTPLIEHTAQWLAEHSELTERVYPEITHSISDQELVDVRTFLEEWRDA